MPELLNDHASFCWWQRLQLARSLLNGHVDWNATLSEHSPDSLKHADRLCENDAVTFLTRKLLGEVDDEQVLVS
jgi:hypothetical protein